MAVLAPSPFRRSAGWLGAVLVLLAFFVAVASADEPVRPAHREYQLKAVLLLNLARFVDWPDSAFPHPNAPLVLGILGQDPFGSYLDEAVKGETIDHRPIVVRRYRRVEDVTACHVVFISASEAENLTEDLAQLSGRGVLTVSDTEGFAQQGGVVGFVKHNDKVRLQINLEVAKASSLAISAKLLRPAEIVGNWRRRPMRLKSRTLSPQGCAELRPRAFARRPTPRRIL